MLAWTWGTWPDVLRGFGGELAVAWRLSEGEVLYRDVAHHDGPLSAYANSILFRAFGESVRTLVVMNLLVLAGIAFFLHQIVDHVAGAFAAAASVIVLFTLFAFAQFEILGSANYLGPYSHEATHGILLSLMSMAALAHWMAERRPFWIAALGILVGLAFLTTVVISLALGAAIVLGLGLGFAADRRGIVRALLLFAGCAAAPAAVFLLLFATAMPIGTAARGLLGSWPEFRVNLGHPRENGTLLLVQAGGWLAALLPAALLALAARRRRRGSGPTSAFVMGAVLAAAALVYLRLPSDRWMELSRPLPLIAFVAFAGALVVLIRTKEEAARRRAILAVTFTLFAFALLARRMLDGRIGADGFALAMPATMVAVAAWFGWIPAFVERFGGRGAFLRGAAVVLFGVAAYAHLSIQRTFVSAKIVNVGEGADAFLADFRGAFVNTAVDVVRSKPDATLAVMPEGAMIAFLARSRMATKHVDYLPPEVARFGEGAMVADLERSRPDLVAITHRSTAEYGAPWFGEDYGADLMASVRERYVLAPLIGGEPLRPLTRFGIRLYALRR